MAVVVVETRDGTTSETRRRGTARLVYPWWPWNKEMRSASSWRPKETHPMLEASKVAVVAVVAVMAVWMDMGNEGGKRGGEEKCPTMSAVCTELVWLKRRQRKQCSRWW